MDVSRLGLLMGNSIFTRLPHRCIDRAVVVEIEGVPGSILIAQGEANLGFSRTSRTPGHGYFDAQGCIAGRDAGRQFRALESKCSTNSNFCARGVWVAATVGRTASSDDCVGGTGFGGSGNALVEPGAWIVPADVGVGAREIEVAF